MTSLVITQVQERGWDKFHQGRRRLTSPVKVIIVRVVEAQLLFICSWDTLTNTSSMSDP